MRLSLWTLSGLILGFGLFTFAIYLSTNNYYMFLNLASISMVLGGTIAATMIAYHGRYVFKALFALLTVLLPLYVSPKSMIQEIEKLIDMARKIRTEGLLSVEREFKESGIKDDFMSFGVSILTTGYDPKEVRDLLSNAAESKYERQMIQANILQSMANFAPAFGMIGTLVGLIIMLEKMGSDVSSIGPGLALALITTLYGIIFAQLIFKPAAEKVTQTYSIMRFRNMLLMEGFVLLSEGKDILSIQDRLNSFLDPRSHIDVSTPEPTPNE